ncbi:MAG: CoA pyrophosphatase [Bdellovibrionales bacterium]|nr:CoA pyrophosphatase [Bdellovibrionales bacterium]
MENSWKKKVQESLALDLPYFSRPLPMEGTPASVLVLLHFQGDDPGILLTRRTEQVETHKGQIAFPGGMRDEQDGSEVETALRETEEEVGIHRDHVEVLGTLPKFWVRSGFLVTPVVAVLKAPVDSIQFSISQQEIDEVFWVSFSQLAAPGVYQQEPFRVGNLVYPIHVYQVGRHRVWGATGAMIKNLLDRLQS